jgi:dTDP-4-amino-4,6-dideoxygalactose transaminase
MGDLKGGEASVAQLAEKERPVAFLDLKAQFAPIRDEVLSVVARVLESQQFIMGSEVAALESEIAKFARCEFALGCASGSDALLLALMAYGVGPGDEVVTTPFTFVATAGSIARLGARPVFADIDPVTYNLDPAKLESAITSRTRAVIPVHLFGLPAEMSSIQEISKRHNLPVIEDAAQAIGAEYKGQQAGSIGSVGCFSFFPSKNLGGAGDGGMVITDDPELADRLRILRLHGSRKKYQHELLGMNSRLDTLQAAILRVKLRHLPVWTAARQRNAERYRILFSEYGLMDSIAPPFVPASCTHVYNQFVIRVQHRDELKAALHKEGIPTEIYYPRPLHLQPAFANLRYQEGEFPRAELASQEVLALPIYPEFSEENQRLVVEAISHFFRSRR